MMGTGAGPSFGYTKGSRFDEIPSLFDRHFSMENNEPSLKFLHELIWKVVKIKGEHGMNENFSLHPDEIELLKSVVGANLEILGTQETPENDEFWYPIFLKFDRRTLKVSNDLSVANYFDGKEDCGRLTIADGGQEFPDAYTKMIMQPVNDIEIVTNCIAFPRQEAEGISAFKFIYPRALIFKFPDSVLSIERGWRFQEYLVAKLQDNSQIELIDEYDEWFDADDPADIRPDFTQTTVSVTKL